MRVKTALIIAAVSIALSCCIGWQAPPAEHRYYVEHTVQQDESLSTIANHYGSSPKGIMQENDLVVTTVMPGDVLIVPVKEMAD